ncbi:MAG: SDR family oxidoreductase [Alistipes sp.]|nr:SDR family oxidoreductase [Alistipes sp.]
MGKFNDKRVLITGGASGIGRLMGAMALEKGAAALVIWDINQANIDSTLAELSAKGKVVGYRVDVSNDERVAQVYKQVKEEVGQIDILINCAGIITSNKTFDNCTTEEIHRTMNINAVAPMVVALQVLPDMVARNSGHICNIASAGGMIANPKMSVYAASKWAAIGWSDSVRIELQEAKSKVRITTIAPYYITTGMFDGVKSPILPLLKPEYAARQIIRAIEHNTNFKTLMRWIPCPHHFIRLMQGIMPSRLFDWLFGQVFGIYHTMDNFTGRR